MMTVLVGEATNTVGEKLSLWTIYNLQMLASACSSLFGTDGNQVR
jgi:hypothetical protein